MLQLWASRSYETLQSWLVVPRCQVWGTWNAKEILRDCVGYARTSSIGRRLWWDNTTTSSNENLSNADRPRQHQGCHHPCSCRWRLTRSHGSAHETSMHKGSGSAKQEGTNNTQTLQLALSLKAEQNPLGALYQYPVYLFSSLLAVPFYRLHASLSRALDLVLQVSHSNECSPLKSFRYPASWKLSFASISSISPVIMGFFGNQDRMLYSVRLLQICLASATLVLICYDGVHRGWWNNINGPLAVGG